MLANRACLLKPIITVYRQIFPHEHQFPPKHSLFETAPMMVSGYIRRSPAAGNAHVIITHDNGTGHTVRQWGPPSLGENANQSRPSPGVGCKASFLDQGSTNISE